MILVENVVVVMVVVVMKSQHHFTSSCVGVSVLTYFLVVEVFLGENGRLGFG